MAVPVDVTDEATVVAAIAATRPAFGGLDAAHVNVADLSEAVRTNDTDAVGIDLAVFDRVVTVDLRGPLVRTKHLVPA